MNILVIGLDGFASEHLCSDERLENLRRLMEFGCYGKLFFEVASDRLGLWMSVVAGQDLGPLDEAGDADQGVIHEKAVWKQIEDQNKGVVIVGLPPFISYPKEIKARVDNTLLELKFQGENLTIQDANQLKDNLYAVSLKQFELVRSLMQSEEWSYFQFSDDGLYQLQRRNRDQSESDAQDLLTDYYLHLDEGIGRILELLDDSTIVLVVSLQTTQSSEGSFILASANNPLAGEIEGTNFLDIAPTLLELGEYEVPAAMQGKSLVTGKMLEAGNDMDLSAEEEEILREQLSGLGYIE